MKKATLLFYFIMMQIISASAQTIISMNIMPTNPTEMDSIYVIIENQFTSGGCEGNGFLNSITGNEIIGGGIHCRGPLTVICTDFDTVIIPPLSAGLYTFIFILSTADQPACNQGSIPLTFDSMQFTVTPTNSISEREKNSEISVFPNPSTGKFYVTNLNSADTRLEILSSDGRIIQSYEIAKGEKMFHGNLPAGIYTLLFKNNNSVTYNKLIVY